MSEVLIECHDVAVGYNDKPVLEHVNLQIMRGEILALLGGSGCGKSTFLRTISGLLPPLHGEVKLFGEPLYDKPVEERRGLLRRTGMAFQQDALFSSMTIEDNVALPLRELTKLPEQIITEMVRLKLAMVGLAGLEGRLPSNLSGGQRKRAALARASILDPELIFCDEPSAGLDPVISVGIDQTLLELRDVLGCTIVVVSHELDSIKTISDRAVMFADGCVVADGTIDELAHSHEEAVFEFFHARAG
jgi:phospholipid/cholesterol/gamma-HCH transport system ATP-binding protein